MASKIYFCITFSFLWITKSIVDGQSQNLLLLGPGGTPTYTLAKLEENNLQSETALLAFLAINSPITACGPGIWRFFPETNFRFLNPAITGYQIGFDDQYRCFNIGNNGPLLAAMRSYRILGPIDANGGINLNQQSITIYKGEFGSDERRTFTSGSAYPVLNIPTTNFPPKSFLLTGEHVFFPDVPDDSRVPVFEIYWDALANTNTDMRTICYSLSKTDANGDYPRMYLQNRMQFVDVTDGQTKAVYMGALKYFSRQNFIDTGVTCHFPTQIVGQSVSMTGFNEVKNPFN